MLAVEAQVKDLLAERLGEFRERAARYYAGRSARRVRFDGPESRAKSYSISTWLPRWYSKWLHKREYTTAGIRLSIAIDKSTRMTLWRVYEVVCFGFEVVASSFSNALHLFSC